MNDFTPGPWHIEGQDIFGNAKNGYICTWSGLRANARLIAAAPDMYEALKNLLLASRHSSEFDYLNAVDDSDPWEEGWAVVERVEGDK